MQLKKIVTLVAATTLMTVAGAQATGEANIEFHPFKEVMSMKMMDKNKDGMVSRKEFLDMMGMAWDMNAKKMGVKGGMMTTDQFKDMLTYMQGL